MSETNKTKRLVLIAMLCALAYVAVALIRIQVVLFLRYEPKDVIIVLGGLMLGPTASVIVSVVSSVVEAFTISDTGLWGLLMNVIASCSFALPAAILYWKKRTMMRAVAGLLLGLFSMAAMMMLWNYIVTPIYMGTPREVVAGMLLPYFLPFNLLKGGINVALTLLIYKPLITALRKARLLRSGPENAAVRINPVLMILALALLAGCIVLAMALGGKL